jgi:DNA-binding LacI/PurR family transcriptional regulator
MHLPMREIGAAALDLLSEAMAGRISLARRIELACHLVERSSTGRLKATG